MFMRRRPLLRAAVVGGGAYVAGKKAGQGSAAATAPAAASAPAAATAPAAASAAAPPMLDQLNQLTTLHQQGSLTDGEFAAAKARLLGT